MSHVMCLMLCVTCHVSRVTCHVSHVTICFSSFFFRQSGDAYRWRVCYQRGLPRLVLRLFLKWYCLVSLQIYLNDSSLIHHGKKCLSSVTHGLLISSETVVHCFSSALLQTHCGLSQLRSLSQGTYCTAQDLHCHSGEQCR